MDTDIKDSNYSDKEQEAVKKVKPLNKKISLIYSNDPDEGELEVCDEKKKTLLTKGMYKVKRISYVAKVGSSYFKKN